MGGNPSDKQTPVYRWDVDNDGNTIGKVPIDRWNDGIKAVVYGLIDRFGYVTTANRQEAKVTFYGRPKSSLSVR